MALSVLDALILFLVAIPIVMKYPVLPGDTPYWLFGVLFLLLGVNMWISFYPTTLGALRKHFETIKNFLFALILFIVLGCVLVTSMIDRAKIAPIWGIHDTILQHEAAMRYLIVGKNPYKETYFGTPVESFNYDEPGNTEATNPALYHFVMPPWYLLFPFTFYYSVRPVVGFFDGRFASIFAAIGLAIIVWFWMGKKSMSRIAISLLLLGPALFDYLLEGRSDIFGLFWLVFSLYLLDKKRFGWSALVMGLALMSKQTVWFAFPFYAALVWFKQPKFTKLIRTLAIVAGTSLTLMAPFILWDAQAFLNSVVFYLSGNSPHSYPVSGYGLGMLLRQMGIIKDIHNYYPFILWQVVVGVPVLVLLLRTLKGKPQPGHFFILYGFFLMLIWYMSRYFNNSHLGYIGQLMIIGLAKIHADEVEA